VIIRFSGTNNADFRQEETILKLRRALTAVLLLLTFTKTTTKFVAAGEGDIKGDITVNPNSR
jgi:hypothetical protein